VGKGWQGEEANWENRQENREGGVIFPKDWVDQRPTWGGQATNDTLTTASAIPGTSDVSDQQSGTTCT
jgi:hypothetical protein